MLISEAFAQTADAAAAMPGAGAPDMWSMIIQFALIIFILYFLLIRPQQKKIRQHEAALNAIVKGSKIIVAGIEGTVDAVLPDDRLSVKIADGTVITVLRAYVSQVVTDDKAKK